MKVTCYADNDLVHAAYATTGLIELAAAGQIDLDFKLCRDSISRHRGPFTMILCVDERVVVCLDFHDSNKYYCRASLDRCDHYYKSNWSRDGMTDLTAEQQAKVRPFGPYLPCRPRNDISLRHRIAGNTIAHVRHRLRSPSGARGVVPLLRQIKHGWFGRRARYLSRMTWDRYEKEDHSTRADKSLPAVFFNPSCWTEHREEDEEVNKLRADLIIGLRRELGSSFAGGLRKNALAEKKYPDAIEDQHYSHAEYVKMLNATPISIYTNGLSGCFSWRLIEIFATSKAIVSDRLVNDPGYDLTEQAGLLQCDDVDIMIQETVALTKDPERMSHMQQAAWRTYKEKMRPAVRIGALLSEIASESLD